MSLNNFSSDLNDHDLGDWLELSLLSSKDGVLSFPELQRQFGILQEEDDEDSDYRAEELTQKLNEIIQDRMVRVGEDSYPFVYSDDGNQLLLKEELKEPDVVYMFCLILSHTRVGDVLNGAFLPNITDAVRRLFQGCSTVAAAGYVEGNAIWFGFPRPDKTGFLEKLEKTYAILKDGKPIRNQLPGTSPSPKDEEIDIIAWKKRADVDVPAYYMLAQVASGNNWEGKSLKGQPIQTFHRNWFHPSPACEAQAAMFMPMLFPLYTHASFEEQVNILTFQFGHFLYRFSIPRFYRKGLELSQQENDLIIDGVDCFGAIEEWVTKERVRLCEAA